MSNQQRLKDGKRSCQRPNTTVLTSLKLILRSSCVFELLTYEINKYISWEISNFQLTKVKELTNTKLCIRLIGMTEVSSYLNGSHYIKFINICLTLLWTVWSYFIVNSQMHFMVYLLYISMFTSSFFFYFFFLRISAPFSLFKVFKIS